MLIDYKNVNIYVQGGVPVLQNVNFHVDEGELIYLIGKVGSGKSSMVLGNDIRTLKRRHIPALRRQMGIIFQDFQLLGDRTVYKNLRFVLKATGWKKNQDIDKRIDDVLEAVGMLDRKDRLPHELSGGEQQRIAIARSILNNPKIIIADEPTGNLDPETANAIIELLGISRRKVRPS